jgi:glucosyl-3-phosphoglycerate phosphatase
VTLRNRYLIMRHGESEANAAHLIVSDPARAVGSYGLTERGRKGVGERVRESGEMGRVTQVCSSDFLRAVQTAEIIKGIRGLEPVRISPLLRERFFGSFEGKSSRHYYDVWEKDAGNPDNDSYGVETPRAVRARMLSFVRECEEGLEGESVLIVSHGDPLQILCAAFAGLSPDRHREVPPLGNADIVALDPAAGFEF